MSDTAAELHPTAQRIAEALVVDERANSLHLSNRDLEQWASKLGKVASDEQLFVDLVVLARRLHAAGQGLGANQLVALALVGLGREKLLKELERGPEATAALKEFGRTLAAQPASLANGLSAPGKAGAALRPGRNNKRR